MTAPSDVPEDRPPHAQNLAGAVAGVLAAAVAIGAAQFASGLGIPQSSPVLAVGQAAIDLTPPQVKDFAISAFGTGDKTALLGGILVILALYAALVGTFAVRRLAFGMWGLAIFAAISLALAAIGVFGVVSYSVTQRTQEFGIRLAVGAQRADILRLTFSEAARLAAAGVVIGLAGAAVLTQFMSTLLFGVSPHDPLTFICVAAFLLAVAGAACIIPARRAIQVDPITALRYE